MKKLFSVLLLLTLAACFLLPAALADTDAATVGGVDSPAFITPEETEAPETPDVPPAPAQNAADDEQDAPAPEEDAVPTTVFGFFPDRLLDSLQYMAKGMGGIFLVTGVIIVALVLLEKAGNRKKEKDE